MVTGSTKRNIVGNKMAKTEKLSNLRVGKFPEQICNKVLVIPLMKFICVHWK